MESYLKMGFHIAFAQRCLVTYEWNQKRENC